MSIDSRKYKVESRKLIIHTKNLVRGVIDENYFPFDRYKIVLVLGDYTSNGNKNPTSPIRATRGYLLFDYEVIKIPSCALDIPLRTIRSCSIQDAMEG